VLLLFGLALFLNVSTSAATTCNTTTPKVTAVDPANHAIIQKSQTIKVKFNETIKAGNNWTDLKNNAGKVVSTKKVISGNTINIIPTSPLTYGKYFLIVHTGSVQNLAGNKNKAFVTSFIVSPLTLAQMKDGIARAQKFYSNQGRLPYTVSFGSNKMPIATFQKIITTAGLKINKPKIVATSNASLAQIMKAASKYRYSGAAHTGKDMERIGSGDCWAMSDYLYTHLTAAGIKSRIIQYATAYSSRHRSVQYIQNNAWVNVPYRSYFSTNMFNNTQSYGLVIKG
jgi:hypothetical protein